MCNFIHNIHFFHQKISPKDNKSIATNTNTMCNWQHINQMFCILMEYFLDYDSTQYLSKIDVSLHQPLLFSQIPM